jgi:FlaA1/EpsC-like NDP-sugar epimerase
MTRYFMTINEAATLVIQAGAIDARAGETPSIFVLDMGEPIKIAELAQRFVRLHGFEARLRESDGATERESDKRSSDRAIDIVFTGARPGEKIHEELAYAAEALMATPYPGIMGLAGSVHADFDVASMVADFSALRTTTNRDAVLEAIRRHVPEMTGQRANTRKSRTKAA